MHPEKANHRGAEGSGGGADGGNRESHRRKSWRREKVRARIFLLIAMLAFPFLALAQERSGDLAVIEMVFTGKELTKQQVEFLCDDIREMAVGLTDYRVMTRENIFSILKDKKVDLSKCAEAECEIEFGRMLQTDKLITSSLLYSGNSFYIKIKLYDVLTASIEKAVSQECKGCDFSYLRQSIENCIKELLKPISKNVYVNSSEKAYSNIEQNIEESTNEKGGIFIKSDPDGANVLIDGSETNNITPYTNNDIEVGTHTVELQKGDLVGKVEVLIKPGIYSKLNIQLHKPKGSLNITSIPPEAEVILNNKIMGITPLLLHNIEYGNYNLIIKKEEYSDYKSNLEINDEVNNEEIVLEKVKGFINIYSYPSGAKIYIDGKEYGETPGNIKEIEKGNHKLKLIKNNKVFTKNINVTGFGNLEKINVYGDKNKLLAFGLSFLFPGMGHVYIGNKENIIIGILYFTFSLGLIIPSGIYMENSCEQCIAGITIGEIIWMASLPTSILSVEKYNKNIQNKIIIDNAKTQEKKENIFLSIKPNMHNNEKNINLIFNYTFK